MGKTVKVGLIGFGMAGRVFHAPTITSVEGLELAMIRETKEPNIEIIKSRYPNATIVNDSKEIFENKDIDLIVVATPNKTHFSLAKEALLAGKHVVADKPFTVNTPDADELIRLAKEQNKLITAYQSRRFDSDFKTVQKVIEADMLGRIVEYEAHYDRFRNFIRPNTWKEDENAGTGLLYDLGSHIIDQALTLFGLPQAIMGDLRTQRTNGKIVDNFEVVLHYPQLKVTLKSGMLVKEPLPRYIVLGENGSFVKYGIDVQEEALIAGQKPTDNPDWGMEPEDIWGTINTTYKGLDFRGKVKSEKGDYVGYYQNVYEAICGNAELAVKPEQARNVIKVIELAMQSSEEKRTLDCNW